MFSCRCDNFVLASQRDRQKFPRHHIVNVQPRTLFALQRFTQTAVPSGKSHPTRLSRDKSSLSILQPYHTYSQLTRYICLYLRSLSRLRTYLPQTVPTWVSSSLCAQTVCCVVIFALFSCKKKNGKKESLKLHEIIHWSPQSNFFFLVEPWIRCSISYY